MLQAQLENPQGAVEEIIHLLHQNQKESNLKTGGKPPVFVSAYFFSKVISNSKFKRQVPRIYGTVWLRVGFQCLFFRLTAQPYEPPLNYRHKDGTS